MTRHVVALVTCPSRRVAQRLARLAVTQRLAACVNILSDVHSVFRWQGKIDAAREVLLLIKTSARRFEALRRSLVNAHPYDVPEVIALPILNAHRPYAAWLTQSLHPALKGGVRVARRR